MIKLGELLLSKGFITEEQLVQALKVQKSSIGKRLGIILCELGFIKESELCATLGEQLNLPIATLNPNRIDSGITSLISPDVCRKYGIFPLFKIYQNIILAMEDPLNSFAIEEVEYSTGLRVEPVIVTHSQIQWAFQKYYGTSSKLEAMLKTMDFSFIDTIKKTVEENGAITVRTEIPEFIEGTVSKIVNMLIEQAVEEGASDIHIEPWEDELKVRYRIDGILHRVAGFPCKLQAAICSSIKLLAQLDIAEKRLPQEGSFQVKINDILIDLRVASYPTLNGEKIVVRILNKESVRLELEQLGLSGTTLDLIKSVIQKPYGIILVTGPTGCGKTTTLYAILQRLNTTEENIITIEDPIEYRIPGINQSQINIKSGLTFSRGLRSILRQDPDIILVGEIRDLETAEIAIEASLTGHLVFATLHTNDAPGAITRLIDLGVEPFLIASAIEGVIAQRLVRVICNECKCEYIPGEYEIQNIRVLSSLETKKFYKGIGCRACHDTGYQKRTGIFSLMLPNEELRMLITKKASTLELRKCAKKIGMETLFEAGLQKALNGITTLNELLRICKIEDELT
ncbi:MAG: ATPase, T2SS/T4P/T4SS family [Candidatus Hydrogenedentota bacterium]